MHGRIGGGWVGLAGACAIAGCARAPAPSLASTTAPAARRALAAPLAITRLDAAHAALEAPNRLVRATISAASTALELPAGRVAMHLARVGRHTLADVSTATVDLRDDEARLVHGDLIEWLRHDAKTIEQGIDLAARPAGVGPLTLAFALDGIARAEAGDDDRSAVLVGPHGARCSVRDLSAVDADGRALTAHVEPRGAELRYVVDDASARDPISIDPLLGGLPQLLVAADGAPMFGGPRPSLPASSSRASPSAATRSRSAIRTTPTTARGRAR